MQLLAAKIFGTMSLQLQGGSAGKIFGTVILLKSGILTYRLHTNMAGTRIVCPIYTVHLDG